MSFIDHLVNVFCWVVPVIGIYGAVDWWLERKNREFKDD